MIQSMTGFGRGRAEAEGMQVVVEMRGLNSRFFEAQVRLSPGLQQYESAVRERLQSRLARGKVAVQAELVAPAGAPDGPVLDDALARRYLRELRRLQQIAGLSEAPGWDVWVRLPGLFAGGQAAVEEELLSRLVLAAVDEALDGFAASRAAEGEALARDLRSRLAVIDAALARVAALAEQQSERVRARLRERVAALLQPGQVPEDRLALEVVLIAERSDITEEIVRFRSHNAQFASALDQGGEVGRRLTFLLQEMSREANTINAKTSQTEILELTVGIKEEVEKLREQVQNVA